jgi:hypothetical protein
MARPKRTDRTTVATETLALRLTEDDRIALDRLVEAARAAVADSGAEITAAGYVRGLIRREAKRYEASASPQTQAPAAAGSGDAIARALVDKAKASGRSQADIARAVGLAPASLSRWLQGKGILAPKHLHALRDELGGQG